MKMTFCSGKKPKNIESVDTLYHRITLSRAACIELNAFKLCRLCNFVFKILRRPEDSRGNVGASISVDICIL